MKEDNIPVYAFWFIVAGLVTASLFVKPSDCYIYNEEPEIQYVNFNVKDTTQNKARFQSMFCKEKPETYFARRKK